MVTVRGEESSVSELAEKVQQDGGLGNEVALLDSGRSVGSLPDLVTRPLQVDVGLREVTLTPGVTLEISLQEDLVMTVRLKQDKSGNNLNSVDQSRSGDRAVLEITDSKDHSRTVTESEDKKTVFGNERLRQSTNSFSKETLGDFSNQTKDDLSIDENGSCSRILDETKDKPKTIFKRSVEELTDFKDDLEDFVNGPEDAERSSSDDEDWTTQNVEGYCRSGYRREEGDSTEEDEWGEIFEDCQDYEEVVTDFGCDYFNTGYSFRDNQLQTIMEEEEEIDEEEEESSEEEMTDKEEDETCRVIIEDLDKDENAEKINDILSLIDPKTLINDQTCYRSDNSVDLDSDAEKSELEQFEILEQLCSSSSDDFDPEEFCKVNSGSSVSETDLSRNDSPNDSEKTDNSSPEHRDRISSFKEYLKRRNSTGSDCGKKKGEYVNKLTLVQENDGRAKVKPVNEVIHSKSKDNTDEPSKDSKFDTQIVDPREVFEQELALDNRKIIVAPDDGLVSYSEWRNGSESDENIDEMPTNDRGISQNRHSLPEQSCKNVGALNSILRSKLADKPTVHGDHNFERKITVIDQNSSDASINDQNSKETEKPSKPVVLKSILKTSTDKSFNVNKDKVSNTKLLKGILKTTKDKCNKHSLSFDEQVEYFDEDSFEENSVAFTDSLNSTLEESACNGYDSYLDSSNLADVSSCSMSSVELTNACLSQANGSLDEADDNLDEEIDSSDTIVDDLERSNKSCVNSDLDNSNGSRSNSFVFKSSNKYVKVVNTSDEFNDSNLDASFEWREMDCEDLCEKVGLGGVKDDGKSKLVDDANYKRGNEVRDLNPEAGSGANVGRRRNDESRRMADKPRIDTGTPSQPQVSIFTSGSDDLAVYDFDADPWFSSPSTVDRTSMRTKKDGSKSSSSSKDTDQSSSTDSNPALPKSALKRPGKKRKKHKVQFDESLNKFFEADYVILIREDECECGGELCCSSFLQDDEDEDSFADLEEESSVIEIPEPPIEFVDQLTLSPPDGYKDTCLPETLNFQQHDGLTGIDEIKSCEDNTTQTTPTSPTLPHSLEALSQGEDETGNDYSSTGTNTGQPGSAGTNSSGPGGDRYIVETITMTTVTERRIVRETLDTSHIQPSREELSLRLVRPCATTKPGSAVRALFPSAVRSPDSEEDTDPLESSLIKRTIERNTLRRSLLKYPGDLRLRRKKQQVPCEESLEEKIRKLTCDIDQEPEQEQRTSPQGQEEQSTTLPQPTYSVSRRLCEVLRKEQHPVALEQQYPSYYESASFLAAAAATGRLPSSGDHHRPMSAVDLRPPDLRLLEARPLSAEPPGARDSVSTDYSLGDIDEVLGDCSRQMTSAVDCRPGDGRPDVLAGTPDPPDELALFVEQDASRIERIRKRYSNSEEESDDYGFSRRPSVRGIKPTFGSTTEILQRMQSQVGPGWPYYPQTSALNGCRPGALTPSPVIRPACQPLCTGQPTAVCPQTAGTVMAAMTAYPQHHPVGVYPSTAYLPYSANGYPPRLYARHDMPLVRATQTPPHYYSRYRVGSPTKGKLEGRIGPEGAASSSHDPPSCDDISSRDGMGSGLVATTPPNLHDSSSIDSSLMYAMNV